MSTEVLSFWASIVCLRFLAERPYADGQGFSHRSSEASRRETLTGSLPVCIIRRKTKAKGSAQKGRFHSLDGRLVVPVPQIERQPIHC